jgi:hypothetical protein
LIDRIPLLPGGLRSAARAALPHQGASEMDP